MRTLDEIAISTGTDKNSNCHNYCGYYSMFFESIRQLSINVLDMGIYHGDSLRMWESYFPNGRIFGADWEDMSQYDSGRIQTYICDQTKIDDLARLAEETPEMDIVIDDMGHQSTAQRLAFQELFPHVKSGGFYCIEDLLCGYVEKFNSGGTIINRVKQMIDEVNMGGKINHDWLCSNKLSERNKYPDLNYFEREIQWVFTSCGLVIIKKL